MKSTPEGNEQLTDIFLLFAEVQLGRPVTEDEFASVINDMLRYDRGKQRYPMQVTDAANGELVVSYRRCAWHTTIAGRDISLHARLKAHGEYAVCDCYPHADGKARHQQIGELAGLLVTGDSGRFDALFDAVSRNGGHWSTVLRDWLSAERYGKRVGVLQGTMA